MQYIMMVGQRPTDLPLGTFLMYVEELDEFVEQQINIQKQATLEALAEFWDEIN